MSHHLFMVSIIGKMAWYWEGVILTRGSVGKVDRGSRREVSEELARLKIKQERQGLYLDSMIVAIVVLTWLKEYTGLFVIGFHLASPLSLLTDYIITAKTTAVFFSFEWPIKASSQNIQSYLGVLQISLRLYSTNHPVFSTVYYQRDTTSHCITWMQK